MEKGTLRKGALSIGGYRGSLAGFLNVPLSVREPAAEKVPSET